MEYFIFFFEPNFNILYPPKYTIHSTKYNVTGGVWCLMTLSTIECKCCQIPFFVSLVIENHHYIILYLAQKIDYSNDKTQVLITGHQLITCKDIYNQYQESHMSFLITVDYVVWPYQCVTKKHFEKVRATDRHDITEILLKVTLSTVNQPKMLRSIFILTTTFVQT